MGGASWTVGRVSFTARAKVEAPTFDPSRRRALLEAIHQSLTAGRLDEAAAQAETALQAGLEHPLVLNIVAERRERAQRFEESLALLTRARALAPDDLGVRQAMGLCLYRLERYRSAIDSFEAVIAAKPDFAPAHAARGLALEANADLPGAEAAYRRALDLDPDSWQALAGMASLAGRRGLYREARPLAEQVLAVAPGFPDAVMTLAQADLAEGDAATAERRLSALTHDNRATAQQAALASGLLGDVLDRQGRYDAAFDAYAACNMRLQGLYAIRYGAGRNAFSFARDMIAQIDAAPAQAWTAPTEAPASGARGHVFLMGFPRSGTTLLEQVLASHPDVEALEERDTLADATSAYLRRPEDLRRLADAPTAELSRLRRAYWDEVARQGGRPTGKVFVDKHPLNAFRLPLIAKLFPDAKVLFSRRDPRDVVLSCFRRRFAMSGSSYAFLTLEGAAAVYDLAMQLGSRLGGKLPLRARVVRHEALVADFDAEVAGICGFLDLRPAPAMSDFAARTRDRRIATPSASQLVGGLSSEGVGHWRRYGRQMEAIAPLLRSWVEAFGYPSP